MKTSIIHKHYRAILSGLFGLFMVCFARTGSAQSTGTIRLLVDPGHNFQFVVDKKFKMVQREVTLAEGLHDLTIWAPERLMVDTPVFVVADRTTDLVVRLPYSSEYKAYAKELALYQTKKRWTRAVPALIGAGGVVYTIIGATQYAKAKKALDVDREDYRINADPTAIRRLKDGTIPSHNKDLKNARTSLYIGGGITAVGAITTYMMAKRTAKWERPIFNDPEKVKFDGLVWMPSTNGNTFMAALSVKLGK